MKIKIRKITKSYGQMTQEEKEYIIHIYYENKDVGSKELQKLLEISHRAWLSVMKEFEINSKRKNRYTLNENYFDVIDTEGKAYCLGQLYADGFVGDEKTNNIVFSSKDKEILVKIAKELEFTGEIRKTRRGGYKNSKEGYSLNFSSVHMAETLREIGLYPNKSLSIDKIPQIPHLLLRHYLRGYFDGDGSITPVESVNRVKGKEYRYPKLEMTIIATEGMIHEIIKTFNIKKCSITKSRTEGMKYLRIKSNGDIKMLYHLFYEDATIYLERKYKVWIDYWGLLHGDMQ